MTNLELITVLQAAETGQVIEKKAKLEYNSTWLRVLSPEWDLTRYDYRVAEEKDRLPTFELLLTRTFCSIQELLAYALEEKYRLRHYLEDVLFLRDKLVLIEQCLLENVVIERDKRMIDCRDKLGKAIHTEDIVSAPGMEKDGVVTGILSENHVQVNPIGEGLPVLLKPDLLEIKSSMINKLASLQTNGELLEIIRSAEERLAKQTDKVKGNRKTEQVAEQTELLACGEI